ncbi:Alpha/beta hydrolase family protein [Parafrankia irregularis]|uniref:Alpha/beta hydrolase family protein n=1 Tax=Parafrankia irregularis TaxID=795642 RepID=A0A0S4QTY5_9ACTN|nr:MULTISPECIES: prolyl oligopeptidase family serine peptidase [Parafrankia]MBE3203682.1 prolyl oligopeptidase family serine peptidase [Parafrankia sp. CH37]CUU59077.1 Alpha/beta hydrolase family protein [Parafrankia irregularis]
MTGKDSTKDGAIVTGWAADVPFTALPPAGGADEPAPLLVTWHMMDAPRSDAAFAAALPLTDVPAWRVHFGMPLVGRRPVDGAYEAAVADPMLGYVDPVVRQATDEFPAALDALRAQLPLCGGPIGVVGGSLGGTVALNILARLPVQVSAVVLINPAVRARTAVDVFTSSTGTSCFWHEQEQEAAAHLDFVTHAALISGRKPQPAVLVVSGELDYPASRADALDMVVALQAAYPDADRVRLSTVAGLEHPLAERPGLEPAPQTPLARVVDRMATEWFQTHLSRAG